MRLYYFLVVGLCAKVVVFVGPETAEDITCVGMDGDAVWVAAGTHVIQYIRGKEVREFFPMDCHD